MTACVAESYVKFAGRETIANASRYRTSDGLRKSKSINVIFFVIIKTTYARTHDYMNYDDMTSAHRENERIRRGDSFFFFFFCTSIIL